MTVDLNRGVTIRRHPHNYFVLMYKDAPGVYYTEAGSEIEPSLAAEAGFNVEYDSTEGQRIADIKAAMAEINKKYQVMAPGEVVETIGDFRVVVLTKDRFNVVDAANRPLNRAPMERAVATEFAKRIKKGNQDG